MPKAPKKTEQHLDVDQIFEMRHKLAVFLEHEKIEVCCAVTVVLDLAAHMGVINKIPVEILKQMINDFYKINADAHAPHADRDEGLPN